MDNQKLTSLLLAKWRNSPVIQDMREADMYYRVENTDIRLKNRNYKDVNGQMVNNETLSNVKIPAAFVRQSVNQKVSYGFGKPFTFAVETLDDTISNNLIERYENEWHNFITPAFRKQLKSIARETISNGIGWGFVSIDEEGNLKVTNVPSETVYPYWTDNQHEKLNAIVRDYVEEIYNEQYDYLQKINKVEFWNNELFEKYIANGTSLSPDTDEKGDNIYYHLDIKDTELGKGWGQVPFIFLKNSDDEMPLLRLIKAQIDAYDNLQSKSVDSLIDDIDAIIVLRGLSPEIKDLVEARELLTNLKITSVDEGGDVSYLKTDINIDNTQSKLENLKKDIKEFSCTVNTQDIEFGSNPTGIALKAAYQDLDIYMNDIETEFELFVQQLKFFFDKWQIFKGNFKEEELKNLKINVSLDRDMMINESELIENTAKLSGLVSQETLDNYNPAVESHQIEEQRREQEKEGENPYNFGNNIQDDENIKDDKNNKDDEDNEDNRDGEK